MSEFNEYENQSADTVSGVENVPKKKKGPVIAGVTAGVIAVAGGGSLIAYNTSDFVKNKVKLSTLSPEKYYAWVNENNSSEQIEYMSESYSEYVDTISKKGVNAKMNVTYTMSDGIKGLAKNAVSGDEQLTSFIDGIETISLNLDESIAGGVMGYNFGLDFNGSTLANLEMFMDFEELYLMGRVPQLKEQYLGFDYKDYTDSLTRYVEKAGGEDEAAAVEDMQSAMMKLYTDPEAILTKEEFKSLAEKYTALWNESVSEVKQEKNKEVTVGEFTNEYTVLTVEINQEFASEVAEKYINALKEDETVKDIVVKRMSICDEDEYISALDEALEEISAEDSEDDDFVLYLETFVDAEGQIRGWTLKDNEETGFEMLFTGESEENANGVISFNADETEMICNIQYTENKGAYNGTVDFSFSDSDTDENVTASVEFKDLKTVNEKYGYCEGTLNISVMDSAPFAITLTSDGSSQKASFDIDIEDINYGNIALEISSDSIEGVEMPDKSSAFNIDMNTPDLTGYATEEDVMNFLTSIVKNMGLAETDEDAMAIIESIMYSGMGNSAYEEYYYDDYDDSYLYDDDYDLSYGNDFEDVDFSAMSDEEFEAYLEAMYGDME